MSDSPRILWIAATPAELRCAPHREEWSYLTTGCGPAAAAGGLAFELGRNPLPDFVIGIGIAGAYPGVGIGMGAVVRLSRDGFVDLGCEDGDGFVDLWSIGVENLGVRREYELAAPAFLAGLPSVFGATCSVCTGATKTADERRNRTKADVETMEGAAWAHACEIAGVPFSQVRAISNVAGPRDKSAWQIHQALLALQQSLEAACEAI